MDHRTIEEHDMIERYHLGSLSREVEERFEAHLLDCAQCQEELEAQRSFLRGLKTVAVEDATRSAVRLGLFAQLLRHRGAMALAGLAVLAVGFASGYLKRREVDTLAEAPVAIPVALVGAVRDTGHAVVVTDPGGPWSLAVDAGADPRFVGYDVTILGSDGAVRFGGRDLLPNVLEVIQLTFPSGFLPPGEYRLDLRGTLPGGEAVDLGGYAFHLTTEPSAEK